MRGVVCYVKKIEDDVEVLCLSWMHCVYVMVRRIHLIHVPRMRMLASQNLVVELDLDANIFVPMSLPALDNHWGELVCVYHTKHPLRIHR